MVHMACYYMQTGHEERGKVGSSESVAAAACALGLCSVLCWLPLFLSSPVDKVLSLLHTGLEIPTSEYLTPDYRVIKAEPAPLHWATDRQRPSVRTVVTLTNYCATLGGTFDRNQLLMMSRSSITLLSD